VCTVKPYILESCRGCNSCSTLPVLYSLIDFGKDHGFWCAKKRLHGKLVEPFIAASDGDGGAEGCMSLGIACTSWGHAAWMCELNDTWWSSRLCDLCSLFPFLEVWGGEASKWDTTSPAIED
jgi:hypothetical protein